MVLITPRKRDGINAHSLNVQYRAIGGVSMQRCKEVSERGLRVTQIVVADASE